MTTHTDDFNRANEIPLASPWTVYHGSGLSLISNAARSEFGFGVGSYYAASWGPDQESMATVVNVAGGSDWIGLAVRASSGNAFEVHTDGQSGGTKLYRRTDDSTTLLAILWAATFVSGDRIRLTVSGTSPNIVLTVYKDTGSGWVQVGQLTGVSGPESGAPGIFALNSGILDDWTGTDGAAPSYPAGLRGAEPLYDTDLEFAFKSAVEQPIESLPAWRAQAAIELQIDPAALQLSGLQSFVDQALPLDASRLVLTASDIALSVSEGVSVQVDPAHLRASGAALLADASLAVVHGALALSGAQVTLTATDNLFLHVDPSELRLSGATQQIDATVEVSAARLTLGGADVPIQVGESIDLAVAHADLRAAGQAAALDIELGIASQALALAPSTVSVDQSLLAEASALRLQGRDVQIALTESVYVEVGAARLALSGQDVQVIPEQDIVLTVDQPARLSLDGLVASVDVAQRVDPAALALAPSAQAFQVDVPVGRAAIRLSASNIGVFVGADVDLSVEPGALTLRAAAAQVATQIVVRPEALFVGPRELDVTIAGAFAVDVEPSVLVLGDRVLSLEIAVRPATVPVDASLVGPRRRGRLYPNIRFEPVRRRKEKPPVLVEASKPEDDSKPVGTGLLRARPGPLGTGLRGRPDRPSGTSAPQGGVAADQTIRTPRVAPQAPKPAVGRGAPVPPPVALELDIAPAHLVAPGAAEVFEQRPAVALSAEDVTAIAHGVIELWQAAQAEMAREERRRARNRSAIELAIKMLLDR